MVSVLRRQGHIDKAVRELSEYLDTFYNDVEGWLELADIYASCNQYVPIPVIHDSARSYNQVYLLITVALSCFAPRPAEPLLFLEGR